MLIVLLFGLGVLANSEYLEEVPNGIRYEDGSDWMPERTNEVIPSMDELGERLRKSVRLLKTNNKLELIFVIDSSSSIGEEGFKGELRFVQKLVADFRVGPGDARVAVIGYASSPKTYVNHFAGKEYEKCSFLHLELPMVEYTGGNTDTNGALLQALEIFHESREDSEKALFLITDGFSNKGDPIPTAKQLKSKGIKIFTFGIQTGNVREVREMSSTPTADYSFVLESFAEFEALVRRALHEDLRSGSYTALNDTTLCDELCPGKNGCCNGRSRCSCGILTGHFACLCPAGFYGSGLVGEKCFPCPEGTYNDGSVPGDILACTACPDINHITRIPAKSEKDCFCREGYVSVRGTCEVATCPVLKVPANGYFVKKNCSNVVNAACGVRCSTGFKLHGSSVRICQSNGTWSGDPPTCVPKSCKKPKPVRGSTVSCKNEDSATEKMIKYDLDERELENEIAGANETAGEFRYMVDTTCSFECLPGLSMIGSKKRTCLPILQWNGIPTSCTVIKCPSLSTLKSGFAKPENCTAGGLIHKFGTECRMSCDSGYRLEGPRIRNCTGRRGTWTGKNVPNKCIDIEPPSFECPENKTVEAAEEESYALVNLQLPDGTDNSGIMPIIWSKPPFLPEYPFPLKIGVTIIEVYGIDGSDNGDSCTFFVQVRDIEAPKIYNCESPPTYYMSDTEDGDFNVTWNEPIFTDNSETPLEIVKSHNFGYFSLGTTRVVYTATDASGNQAECVLNITVSENPCRDRPSLGNVEWNCSSEGQRTECSLFCPPGLTWTTSNDISDMKFICQYDRNGARWHPDIFSDVETIPECSVFEVPTEVVETNAIELDGEDVSCEDIDQLSLQISNRLNILIGSEEPYAVSIDCLDENPEKAPEEYSNDIPIRRKRNAKKRKRVKIRVSLPGHLTNNTSDEGFNKYLHDLGRKVEEEYKKNPIIGSDGKKVSLGKTKVSIAKLKCKAGFALKRGLCVKCPPGTFYDSSKSNCIPCPIGMYQNLEGQIQCEACPSGHLTKRRRRKNIKDCKKICPPGTFGRRKNKGVELALMPCHPCPLGSYQSSPGQTSCVECASDKTTKKKGSSRPEQCLDKIAIEDPCYGFNCLNNGTCFVYNGFPTCQCLQGYLGSFCEKERNHCDSSPCYNNGECVPGGPTSFACLCPPGYEGDLCQFDIDECSSDPCKNGAVCVDLRNDYRCECPPGFTGRDCDEDIDECKFFNNPCWNGGVCNDLINDYNCTCLEGFSGKHCEEVSECDEDDLVDKDCKVTGIESPKETDPCRGVVCPPNMECVMAAGSRRLPLCLCRKGFFGRDCSEEINFNVIIKFGKSSVSEYLSCDFPPEDLNEISVCLWIQTADDFNYGTLFSYALPGSDNVFTVTDYKGFVLYVKNDRVVTDIEANDGFWHFLCFTWESTRGEWNIYVDGKNSKNSTGLSPDTPIPGGGRFIIGQEQDRFGGGFNEIESFVGKITHFDVWKRVLQPSEILDMYENCKYFEGDLLQWIQFLENIHGNVEIGKSSFCTNCNVRNLRLFRGQITVENVGDSIYAVYKCDKGFRIRIGDDEEGTPKDVSIWYRKCLKHGHWEPATPICNRISCGFPGYIPHGTILGNSYSYSSIIEYRCDHGYTMSGNSTRTCLENGSWSGDKPTCIGSNGLCEEIVAPRHGSMFINSGEKRKLNSSSIGDKAEFVCDEGYTLRGHETLTCSEEGLWDHDAPTCQEVACRFPYGMENDVVNSTSKEEFVAGEKLHVKCSETGEVETIGCLPGGFWNYTGRMCGSKCRGKPNYPEHGIPTGDPLKHVYDPGETFGIKCRYGFKLLGEDFFTCSLSGTWYQSIETRCNPVECSKPVPPPNAYSLSIFHTYPFGRRILFRCVSGYRQLGDLMTQCDGDGKWTKLFGRCVDVSFFGTVQH